MNQRLQEVLKGDYGNYILPFFWQHGATEAVLREYMEKIDDCGIRAVCLEARPHPDYVGPKWWQDVDVVMDEARKRGMQVWILDDSHFPTGYANGAVKDAPDALKRWYLLEKMMDVDGPALDCRYEVAAHLGYEFFQGRRSAYQKEELVAVILGRRCGSDKSVYYTDFTDVTEYVTDGWLYMDIPEGSYCIFIYTKKLGAASKASDHISFLERESCKILIDTVYESHYTHYKDDFGSAFAGFFSDEPGFYNLNGQPFDRKSIGDKMPLPWSDGVKARLEQRLTGGKTVLPGLFNSCGGLEGEIRYTYMDIITNMYRENFSEQLGDWCEEHHVEYIGHVLEDGGLHSRLGPGIGHYFRAMAGQHMSGIDVVLNQLLPEQDYGRKAFYHYSIAPLAASAAHQNPRMKGRAMCEIFGAFGWSEGISMMKWMADHMMVNGINTFVPHAFTEKAFPDPDCPPHFYAHGNNPQYRYMHILYNYMNRISHLLNGGHAFAEVAVFFPAEGEWAGKYREYGYLGKMLLQHQISYEVVCMDALKTAVVEDGRMIIGNSTYKYLFVDSIERLPADYLEVFADLYAKGAGIRYVGNAPVDFDGNIETCIPVIDEGQVLPMVGDSCVCKADGFYKWLRCYAYMHEDLTIYMLVNSSMAHTLDVTVTLPKADAWLRYNGLDNTCMPVDFDEDGRISLHFDKGESFLLLAGELDLLSLIDNSGLECGVNTAELVNTAVNKANTVVNNETGGCVEIDSFLVSLADYTAPEHFELLAGFEHLGDVALAKNEFSGIIRYTATFEGKACKIDLGRCYEAAEVFINDMSASACICYPYTYDLRGLTKEGSNTLRIEVATTLANACMDHLSMERAVEPEGLFGPVRLWKE